MDIEVPKEERGNEGGGLTMEELVEPLASGRPGHAPLAVAKGDIVWIIFKKEDKAGAMCMSVTDDDLERTADDFAAKNEIIGGGLFVVKNPRVYGRRVMLQYA